MNSKEIKTKEMQYLDVDYMNQIEELKKDIVHIYVFFILMMVLLLLFFLIIHIHNRRLVKVELKMEIHGDPIDEKPLMCGI